MRLVIGALQDVIAEVVGWVVKAVTDEEVRVFTATLAGIAIIVGTIGVVMKTVESHEWSTDGGILAVIAAIAIEGVAVLFGRALYRRWRHEHKRKNDND